MNMIRTDLPAAPALDRLIDRARALLQDRRPADAALLLERAVLLPEAPAEAFGLLAEARADAGDEAGAAAAADRAIALRPDDPMLRLLRGRIRRALGDATGATDDAAAAVMADPTDREAKSLLATCLSEAGLHDEAILLFHQAFLSEPQAPHRAAMLAMAFMRAGRHDAAEEMYALAHGMAPYARGIVPLRAQNALLAQQPERALALLRDAIAQRPDEVVLHTMLGQACQRLGRMEEAAAAYAEAARRDPGNDYVAHLAAATGLFGDRPDRAPDRYVAEVFDGYANRFEKALFALGYRVPGVMLRMLERHVPGLAEGRAKLGDILDLGCGTGLMGATLHDLLGGRLVGVDLSERMLAEARAKQIYTELRHAEIGAALAADDSLYDIVTVADVLCYFGALEPVLGAIRARLRPGGALLLSVEAQEPDGTWRLQANARYCHAPGYLRTALEAQGFVIADWREEAIRWDSDRPVPGIIALTTARS